MKKCPFHLAGFDAKDTQGKMKVLLAASPTALPPIPPSPTLPLTPCRLHMRIVVDYHNEEKGKEEKEGEKKKKRKKRRISYIVS